MNFFYFVKSDIYVNFSEKRLQAVFCALRILHFRKHFTKNENGNLRSTVNLHVCISEVFKYNVEITVTRQRKCQTIASMKIKHKISREKTTIITASDKKGYPLLSSKVWYLKL